MKPSTTAPVKRACDRYVSAVHIHILHHSLSLVAAAEESTSALLKTTPLARTASLLALHAHTKTSHRRKALKAAAPKSSPNFAKLNVMPNLLPDSQPILDSMAGHYPRHLLAHRAL